MSYVLTKDDMICNPEAPYFWISYIAAQALFFGRAEIVAKVEYGAAYIERPLCEAYGLPWMKCTPVLR